jgi:wingless-type MMTV integration site family protein 5
VPTKTELGNETSADNTTVVATTLSPEEQAKADDMLKLQQKITQELLNSNLKENERNELQVRKKAEKTFSICISLRYFFYVLQEKINKEILNSKLFGGNDENVGRKKGGRFKQSSIKARSLMNLHNNEAGRRVSLTAF